MSAININKNNFQNEIMNSEKTVLLDFGLLGVPLAVCWLLSYRRLRVNVQISKLEKSI